MRKIDKSDLIATEYHEWLRKLEDAQIPHEKHSSKHFFYIDVVMNLLYCQKGLCAYTEQQLCAAEDISLDNWENGKYKNSKENIGHLEHFDEVLKAKDTENNGRKDWLWSNLFVVASDTNVAKGTKRVNEILKPDNPDYDPFKYLDYDIYTHIYVAKEELPDDIKQKVKIMIETLGLNKPNNLIDIRKKSVNKRIREIELDFYEYSEYDEYPTALAFCRKHKQINTP